MCVNALNGLLSFLLNAIAPMSSTKSSVNALNGLLSFLPFLFHIDADTSVWCQRPKRASFISTLRENSKISSWQIMCQRPKRASFISTYTAYLQLEFFIVCQRPKRASFISTYHSKKNSFTSIKVCVNALNGLLSFLHGSIRRLSTPARCVSTP